MPNWRSGRRDTGLTYPSYSMAQKMGWAVGSAATAWILSLAGFEAKCRASRRLRLPVIRVCAKRLPGFGRFGDMCLHSVLSAGRRPANKRFPLCPILTISDRDSPVFSGQDCFVVFDRYKRAFCFPVAYPQGVRAEHLCTERESYPHRRVIPVVRNIRQGSGPDYGFRPRTRVELNGDFLGGCRCP